MTWPDLSDDDIPGSGFAFTACTVHEDPGGDAALARLRARLLTILRRSAVHRGTWRFPGCPSAWDGNRSSGAFVAFAWQDPEGAPLLLAVNYPDHPGQCYVRVRLPPHGPGRWRLLDSPGDVFYERDGHDLQSRGLHPGVAPWKSHVFGMKADPEWEMKPPSESHNAFSEHCHESAP